MFASAGRPFVRKVEGRPEAAADGRTIHWSDGMGTSVCLGANSIIANRIHANSCLHLWAPTRPTGARGLLEGQSSLSRACPTAAPIGRLVGASNRRKVAWGRLCAVCYVPAASLSAVRAAGLHHEPVAEPVERWTRWLHMASDGSDDNDGPPPSWGLQLHAEAIVQQSAPASRAASGPFEKADPRAPPGPGDVLKSGRDNWGQVGGATTATTTRDASPELIVHLRVCICWRRARP